MKLKTMFVVTILICFISSFTVTAQTICDNQVGTQGSWTYEYWKDQGSGCMVLGDGGSFSCDWNNINNLLARKGLRPGSTNQVVTYSANYNPNGNSYLCIYGWTKSPLVEYYIVDSWGTWRPPGGEGAMGTMSSDGATYDIYRTQRVNQPSIEGNTTFYQFWSVRQSKRTSGTISCGNHFSAWASKGMNMGNLYEVSMCVEGYQSSGTANITSMSMTTGTGSTPDPTSVPTNVPTAGPTPLPGTAAIACGNSSGVGNFLADQYYSGGETYNNSNTVNVSQITTDTPPAELFNNERYGAMSYTIPGFTSGNSYIVTLYFAETYLTSSGSRVFNVTVNGTAALSNFDIYAAAGGQDRAIAREITTTANSSGQIVIQFTSVTENPKINGISIKPGSGSTTAPTTAPTSAPTAVTTAAPTVPPGDCNVYFNPQNSSQGLNSTFNVDVVVNSGNQELAAYGITVTYNAGILNFVDIEEGVDGFLAAANTTNPGEIVASGFDSSGTGPGSNLQVLVITFEAIASGTTTLGLNVDQLVDGSTSPIGTACGNSGSVTVTDVLRGDTNGDGVIDIVDALLLAQYYVDLDPPGFNPGAADTDCNGSVDIVDALLIAQYYVDLINGFCL